MMKKELFKAVLPIIFMALLCSCADGSSSPTSDSSTGNDESQAEEIILENSVVE